MKKGACLLVLGFLIIQGFAASVVVDDFEGDEAESILELIPPGLQNTTNVTLPAKCHVLNATLKIAGLASGLDSSDCPSNVTVSIGNDIIWGFNGKGYGPLGGQTVFSDGNKSASWVLGDSGGTGTTTFRLPKEAVVQTTSMDLICAGPDITVERTWNASEPKDTFFLGSGTGSNPFSTGDFNADGCDDLLVGAWRNNSGTWEEGAYLYFGGASINAVPDAFFIPNISGAKSFRASDSSFCGDVNGDGFDDVICQVEIWYESSAENGIFIFLGGNEFSGKNCFFIKNPYSPASYQTTSSISGVGDVNGDGYDDILLGTSPYSEDDKNGHACIFYGGREMDGRPDVEFTNNLPGSCFGQTLCGIGDVNGDGYYDFVIGAPKSKIWSQTHGCAYLYYGSKDLDSWADLYFWGENAGNETGYTVCGAGDVNGDGYSDVLVGNPSYNERGLGSGKVSIYYGGAKMNNVSDVDFKGENPASFVGFFKSIGAADFNDDGFSDIGIYSYLSSPEGLVNGSVLDIYLGGLGMDNVSDLQIVNETADAGYAAWIGEYFNAGDVNGDDLDEIFVSNDFYTYPHNESNDENWRDAALYSFTPRIEKPWVKLSDLTLWSASGAFGGRMGVSEFSTVLNEYVRDHDATESDSYGTQFIDVPLTVGASGQGVMKLKNLRISYSYNATVPDFAETLNRYIHGHPSEANETGRLSVPIKVVSDNAGRIELFGLNINIDTGPEVFNNIPDLDMPEDTWNSSLIDVYDYFKDEFDSGADLSFSIVYATNTSKVNVTILDGRYLSADVLTGDANDNWTGAVNVIVKCSDIWNLSVLSRKFNISIVNINDPPVITSKPALNATVGKDYFYDVRADDGDNDNLTFILGEGPQRMTVDSGTGRLKWSPKRSGLYNVSIKVSDESLAAFQNYTIEVMEGPGYRKILGAENASAGGFFNYSAKPVSLKGENLTFELISSIDGMTINSSTGWITWVVKENQIGDSKVMIRIINETGDEEIQEMNIRVWARPELIIEEIGNNGKVSGNIPVRGSVKRDWRIVTNVGYRFDNGSWKTAIGTDNWSFSYDSRNLKNGRHVLEVAAFNGSQQLCARRVALDVENPDTAGRTDVLLVGGAAIILIVAIGSVVGYYILKRNKP